ncbi:hypothetical protein I3843_08G170600 [Carya illinoinensis]|nr:hypothetical protein I3843_08G170600 [Carya illinoinensis]
MICMLRRGEAEIQIWNIQTFYFVTPSVEIMILRQHTHSKLLEKSHLYITNVLNIEILTSQLPVLRPSTELSWKAYPVFIGANTVAGNSVGLGRGVNRWIWARWTSVDLFSSNPSLVGGR